MINLQFKAEIDRTNPMKRSIRSLCIDFSVNKKVFECTSCPKKFKKPSSLKAHTFSHSKEKPHRCLSPGCDKSFSLPSNLRRHKKMVHKKKSSTQTHRKLSPPRKLEPLAQCKSTTPEEITFCPSSLHVRLVPSSISSSWSSSLPLTKEESLSSVVVRESSINTDLPSSIFAPSIAQVHDIHEPIDPNCQPYLVPKDLTEFCIDPSKLIVPSNNRMKATYDNNTTTSHSSFDNNNVFPTDFNQSDTSPQYLFEQQNCWLTATLSQVDIFPF